MSSAITIARVTKENYSLFDELAMRRMRWRSRSEGEQAQRDRSRAVEVLADPNLMVYAAVWNDQWVGWISLIYMPKVGRTNGQGYLLLDDLWTHPDYRRKGVAKRLMAQAEAACAQRHALGIRLVVSTDNREAIALCQSCGYADRDVALFMEKSLSESDA